MCFNCYLIFARCSAWQSGHWIHRFFFFCHRGPKNVYFPCCWSLLGAIWQTPGKLSYAIYSAVVSSSLCTIGAWWMECCREGLSFCKALPSPQRNSDADPLGSQLCFLARSLHVQLMTSCLNTFHSKKDWEFYFSLFVYLWFGTAPRQGICISAVYNQMRLPQLYSNSLQRLIKLSGICLAILFQPFPILFFPH